MMMKPTLLLAIIGVAIAALFGYHKIYLPQQAQGRLIQTQIDQEQDKQRARADVAALFQEIEHYQKQLPPEPEPSWLVREAVAQGQRVGIEMTSFTQDAPQPREPFTRLSAKFQFRASYHQLGTFLDRLERSDHYVRVESLDLSPTTDEGGLATIRLVLSTVYLPPVRRMTGSP